jgi:hypothetical protein
MTSWQSCTWQGQGSSRRTLRVGACVDHVKSPALISNAPVLRQRLGRVCPAPRVFEQLDAVSSG